MKPGDVIEYRCIKRAFANIGVLEEIQQTAWGLVFKLSRTTGTMRRVLVRLESIVSMRVLK